MATVTNAPPLPTIPTITNAPQIFTQPLLDNYTLPTMPLRPTQHRSTRYEQLNNANRASNLNDMVNSLYSGDPVGTIYYVGSNGIYSLPMGEEILKWAVDKNFETGTDENGDMYFVVPQRTTGNTTDPNLSPIPPNQPIADVEKNPQLNDVSKGVPNPSQQTLRVGLDERFWQPLLDNYTLPYEVRANPLNSVYQSGGVSGAVKGILDTWYDNAKKNAYLNKVQDILGVDITRENPNMGNLGGSDIGKYLTGNFRGLGAYGMNVPPGTPYADMLATQQSMAQMEAEKVAQELALAQQAADTENLRARAYMTSAERQGLPRQSNATINYQLSAAGTPAATGGNSSAPDLMTLLNSFQNTGR